MKMTKEQDQEKPRWTPWSAWAKHKNGVRDRLGRYEILGPGERARPVIADNIRTEADALVMAAAPELLTLLKSIMEHEYVSGQTYDEIEAAIAKAEGR
jgi:hypothetical protein